METIGRAQGMIWFGLIKNGFVNLHPEDLGYYYTMILPDLRPSMIQ